MWAKHVEDAVQRKREEFVRATFQLAASLLCFAFAILSVRICLGTSLWMTAVQTVLLFCLYPVAAYMGYSKRQHGLATIRCACAVFAATAAVFVLIGDTRLMVVVWIGWVAAPYRVLLSIVLMDKGFSCLVNCLITLASEVALYRADHDTDGSAPFGRSHFMLAEACNLIIVFTSAAAFQEVMYTSRRHALEARFSKSESYAAVKIMNAVCDAVVQLDSMLQVANKETNLAALLLHGPGRCLTGSSFVQHLASEDRHQAFRDWLHEPPEKSDAVVGFEAKLRDSNGNHIDVEMFHVPFEKAPDTSHHFIGIREKSTDIMPLRDAYRNDVRPPLPLVGVPSSSDSGVSSDSNTTCDYLAAEDMQAGSGPLFKFDAVTFEILGSSVGFTIGTFGPPHKGTLLTSRLRRCEVNDKFYLDFALNVVQVLRSARRDPNPVELEYPATMLFSPQGCRHQFRMEVQMALHSTWAPGADREDCNQLPSLVATVVVTACDPERPERRCTSSGANAAESGDLSSPVNSQWVSL